jgi:hypothetical protein
MILIETTASYGDVEEAQDALASLTITPGYRFAYIRLSAQESGDCEIVSIFECAEGSSPGKGQRRVLLESTSRG